MTSIEEKEHHIRRERFYTEGPDGMVAYFQIGEEDYDAKKSKDVDLTYHSRVSWQGGMGTPLPILDYPKCPDCGGIIIWAENGGVPGSRKCEGCGSRYVDTTYGVASEVPE